jgi:hypothetical protein
MLPSLVTFIKKRSKNRERIELPQGTFQYSISYSSRRLKDLLGALPFYCRNATHICQNAICISARGTLTLIRMPVEKDVNVPLRVIYDSLGDQKVRLRLDIMPRPKPEAPRLHFERARDDEGGSDTGFPALLGFKIA